MKLTLKVESFCGSPTGDAKTRTFDAFPVIIGRSTACDFILTDVSKYISSNHASLFEQDGVLFIQDTSANGTYLNGTSEPIGRDNSASLAHADTITIGDYSLSVAITSADQPPTDPFDSMHDDLARSTPVEPDVYDPFKGAEHDWTPPSSQDPESGDWDEVDASDGLDEPGRRGFEKSAGSPGPSGSGDEDWADWDLQPSHAPADVKPHDDSADNAPRRTSVDDWLPDEASQAVTRESVDAAWPDFDARRVDQTSPPAKQRPSLVDPRQSAPDHRPIPRPTSHSHDDRQQPQYASMPKTRAVPGGSDRAAIDALLSAAGMQAGALGSTPDRDVLEASGRLMHIAVSGMMSLLHTRTELKNAVRSDVTQLGRTHNNPLKFSYSPEDALVKLLTSDDAGYLDAESAMTQAVDDLKLHQLAMLEGMKAAVKSILLEFDPRALQKALESDHPIAASIPFKREAELWQLFQDQYSSIRDEAVSNFGELFGKEFRRAYEQRIRKSGREPDF